MSLWNGQRLSYVYSTHRNYGVGIAVLRTSKFILFFARRVHLPLLHGEVLGQHAVGDLLPELETIPQQIDVG